jgi:xylulose-5-phosphate/fructose-6-phosphate phosphoketolase
VIDRVDGLAQRASHLRQTLHDKLAAHRRYVDEYGDDMPEIRNWRWPAARGAQSSGETA